MVDRTYEVLIIGAGVTGMSAGNKLITSSKIQKNTLLVIEKENEPGGLLRTTQKGRYWWDNGVFFFHHNRNNDNQHHIFRQFPEIFRKSEIRSEQAWHNEKLKAFPFTPKELLFAMSFCDLLLFPFDFLYHWICRNVIKRHNKNLKTWIYDRITPLVYKHTGLDYYIEKLMGLPIERLSYKFGEDRLSFIDDMSKPSRFLQANLNRIINANKKVGKNIFNIYYPKGNGVSEISKKFSEKLINNGGIIYYGTKIKEISFVDERKKTYRIICEQNGEKREFFAKHILSTIPLEILTNALHTPNALSLQREASKLRYRSLFIIGYIINKKIINGEHQVIYSLGQSELWKRLFIRKLTNSSEYSVTVEIPYDMGKEINTKATQRIVDSDLINKLRLFSISDIIERNTVNISHAYPVAFCGYNKIVTQLVDQIESLKIYTAGRQGQYDYCNVTGSIKWGEVAADKIIQRMENLGA